MRTEGLGAASAGPPPSSEPSEGAMSNRILIGLAALVGAGFVAFFGGAFATSPSTPPARARRLAVGRGLQGRLRAQRQHRAARRQPPVDARARTRRTSTRWVLLGLAYQQRARETGDPTYYTKSDGALEQRARARPEGLPRLQRPRLARALAPPLPRGARARRAGARARADDARNYGVDRRRARRARPLPARRSGRSTR